MELNIVIQRGDMLKRATWLLQIDLDQKTYGDFTEVKKKKLRSEIVQGTHLVFEKNHFLFDISLSNMITIKLGMLEVLNTIEKEFPVLVSGIDPGRLRCEGVTSIPLTLHFLTELRDNLVVTRDFPLRHPETHIETGNLSLKFSLHATGVEEQIIEDIRLLDQVKFDVYETDETTQQEKLSRVEALLDKKSEELGTWMEEVDFLKNAVRSLGVDSAVLIKQKQQLERENTELKKELHRHQNVDDIHIKYDMLSTSNQGIQILKKEYEKINIRLKVERLIYNQLSEQWDSIEAKERALAALKKELETVKEAQKGVNFEMLILRDLYPEIRPLRDTIKMLNAMIKQYEHELTEFRSLPAKMMRMELDNFKHRQVMLSEKHKQVKILLEQNDGVLPAHVIEEIKALEEPEDEGEIKKLKARGRKLLREIEELSNELSNSGFKSENNADLDAIELAVKLEAANERVNAMQERMDIQAKEQARVVADFVGRLSDCDAIINSRKRY